MTEEELNKPWKSPLHTKPPLNDGFHIIQEVYSVIFHEAHICGSSIPQEYSTLRGGWVFP